MESRWMDLEAAGRYTSLPVKALRRAILLGLLPFSKPGRKIVLDVRDIDSWLMTEKKRIEQ